MNWFHEYQNPSAVGWLGYFIDTETGDVVAFVGLDRRVVFAHEIKGWNPTDWSIDGDNDPPDPADWWKE